ncbi:gamma-glutamyltransferase, partial [Klebsiella pneumoniae]|uniref:gamma-glutamyltransferase n=1 Tax=Klebsiella pneumoniae TaxID=573 RepID=UPI003EE36F13
VTYTLNTTFGTGIVAGDSGILLNNQMDDFSAKPGVPNVYGLVAFIGRQLARTDLAGRLRLVDINLGGDRFGVSLAGQRLPR